MKKKIVKKKNTEERKIDPSSFYQKIGGRYYHDPNKTKINITNKSKEPLKTEEIISTIVEPIPKPFSQKDYKEKANKNLENIGANVRVYNKNSINLLASILIGVIIVFGLFFVWSVSNDKFKTDFDCPDCNCEKAELFCEAVKIPDCNCDQSFTCERANNSDIINAINNLNINITNVTN